MSETYAPGDRLARTDHSGPGDPGLVVCSVAEARGASSTVLVLVQDASGDRSWLTAEELRRTTLKRDARHFTSKIASAVNTFGRFWSDEHAECCCAAAILLYSQASEKVRGDILRAMRYHRVILRERCPELEIAEEYPTEKAP